MQLGIKSEIHSCTITVVKTFLKDNLKNLEVLDTAFTARNNLQYYTDRNVSEEDFLLIKKSAQKGERVKAQTPRVLKCQAQGMNGPPGQPVAQEDENAGLQAAQHPDGHFGEIEAGLVYTEDVGSHRVI